jgi:hypothetical protein
VGFVEPSGGHQEVYFGEEHPDTLTSLSNLASTYAKSEQWDEAEAIQAPGLEAMQRVLGVDHATEKVAGSDNTL